MKLPFKRRGNKFVVRLTARGKQHFLGMFEAKDYNDLLAQIMSKLEELGDIAKQYSRIRVTNVANGEEISIENPFFEGDLDSARGQSTRSNTSLIDDVLVEQITMLFKFQQELMKMALSETAKAAISAVRDVMREAQRQSAPANESLEALKAFATIVMNWDKAKEMISEFRRKLGGGLGGGGRQGSPGGSEPSKEA